MKGIKYLEKYIPASELRWLMRFIAIEEGISQHSRLLEMLDIISDLTPPIRETIIAKNIGISVTMVSRYLRWLKEKNIKSSVRYSLAALGLGSLIIYVKNLKKRYPELHWLSSAVATGKGFLLSYRYPFEYGSEFIRKSVKKYSEKTIWVKEYEEKIFPNPKLKYYWSGIFADPEQAFEIALEEHPTTVTTSYKIGKRPRDILDLFILAILEKDALLKYVEISKYLRDHHISYPRKRINIHVQHLLADGIIAGVSFKGITLTSNLLNFLVEFGSRKAMRNSLSVFLRYLYTSFVQVNKTGEALISLAAPLESASFFCKVLTELMGAEVIDYVVFSRPNIMARYTLPYRNYDPFIQNWSRNPADIDRWLKEKGYYTS